MRKCVNSEIFIDSQKNIWYFVNNKVQTFALEEFFYRFLEANTICGLRSSLE